MVLYFTGTGNSRHIAERIAHALNDTLISLNDRIKSGDITPLAVNGRLVLVMPTYAWRIPRIVRDHLLRTELRGARETWFVMDCGSEIGNAAKYNRALCREKGILFLVDEVQGGLFRTGKPWAFQHFDLKPDAISCAKALANGLPMGAMMTTDEVSKGFVAGSHATTFGGGALTSAVAAKVVRIMKRDHLDERAASLGGEFMESIRRISESHPGTIKEVRGLGLMIGIELAFPAKAVWEELIRRGFICNLSHEVVLRLLPALNIPEEDLRAFADTLEDILANIKK